MRLIIFALILTSAITAAAAQTPFETATQNARNGQYEKALEDYRRVLISQPDNAKAHFNIGVCLYHLGRPEKAVAEYQKAIGLSGGKYQKAFYALGMAQSALKDHAAAKAAFYRATELDKNDGEAWFDLAMVLLDQKDYDSATDAFENAVRNNSINSADAINNIGVITAIKGDLDGAEKNFKIALELSENRSIEAANNLMICVKYRQANYKEMIAGLIFSDRKNSGE